MKARKIFCALLTLVTIISGSVTKDVYADEPSFLSENTQIIEKSLEQSDINVIKVSQLFTIMVMRWNQIILKMVKMREIIW